MQCDVDCCIRGERFTTSISSWINFPWVLFFTSIVFMLSIILTLVWILFTTLKAALSRVSYEDNRGKDIRPMGAGDPALTFFPTSSNTSKLYALSTVCTSCTASLVKAQMDDARQPKNKKTQSRNKTKMRSSENFSTFKVNGNRSLGSTGTFCFTTGADSLIQPLMTFG